MRVSFVGELGYELHIPWDRCLPVYRVIWKEGKKHNLRHAGYRALYSLSAEKGKSDEILIEENSSLYQFTNIFCLNRLSSVAQ